MKVTSNDLQTISKIYDAALDPSQWNEILNELVERTGSIASNVFIADFVHEELTDMNLSDRLISAVPYYLENGFDKADMTVLSNAHKFLSEQDLVSVSDVYNTYNKLYGGSVDQTAFEQYLATSIGINHRYTTPLNFRKSYLDFATFHFDDMKPDNLKATLSHASLYLPHLSKVVELSRPFSLLKARFNAVLSVLDRFHLGVFIFSSAGTLTLSNQAADKILDDGDGLKLGRRNLDTPFNSSVSAQLKHAFSIANKVMEIGSCDQQNRVVVPRYSDSTSYIVDISPLRNRELDFKINFQGVVAIIVDPDDHDLVDISGLDLLYSLTEAEKEVCKLLVSGHTTNEIADSRNTNSETTRKQINMLLNKTETRGRAELVHLAHSVNLPIDKPQK